MKIYDCRINGNGHAKDHLHFNFIRDDQIQDKNSIAKI